MCASEGREAIRTPGGDTTAAQLTLRRGCVAV